jgi:hypothetical protein
MKSAFGSKRKARKIEVDEDDGPANDGSESGQSTTTRVYTRFIISAWLMRD